MEIAGGKMEPKGKKGKKGKKGMGDVRGQKYITLSSNGLIYIQREKNWRSVVNEGECK